MTKKTWQIFSAGMFVILLFCLLVIPSTAAPPFSGLEWVSSEGTSGSVARVPLVLSGMTEPISELELTLTYNPSFLLAIDVVKGDIGENATLKAGIDRGEIHLTIKNPDGISEGTIASVRFNVLASTGSSPLQITHLTAKSLFTRSPLFIGRKDGIFTIIPGVSFSTSAAGQRIAVERALAGERVTVNGNAITFLREGSRVTCLTEGLAESGGRLTGIVKEVTIAPLPSSLNLSSGQVTARLILTTTIYESEGRLMTMMSDTVFPVVRERITAAGEKSRITVSTVLFTMRVTVDGFTKTESLTGSFTLPASVIPSRTNETLFVSFLKDDGKVEVIRPTFAQIPDTNQLSLTIPIKQGYPTIAILLAQEVVRPPPTIIPHTTSENIFSEGGQSATGSIWGGMFLIFFLVAVVVIGVFYVHRKRGG